MALDHLAVTLGLHCQFIVGDLWIGPNKHEKLHLKTVFRDICTERTRFFNVFQRHFLFSRDISSINHRLQIIVRSIESRIRTGELSGQGDDLGAYAHSPRIHISIIPKGLP